MAHGPLPSTIAISHQPLAIDECFTPALPAPAARMSPTVRWHTRRAAVESTFYLRPFTFVPAFLPSTFYLVPSTLRDRGPSYRITPPPRNRTHMPLLSDLKFALRSLARATGLSLTVILPLALGIGANASIFSVVRGVLLRPLVNRDEGRLIYIQQSAPGNGV